MPQLRIINLDRRKHQSIHLDAHREDVYSQSGEDGVIKRIFEMIEPRNRWCVEFGAWDGVHLSNTCRLIREEGWNGLQIEGSKERYDEMVENFRGVEGSHPVHRVVGFEKGENALDDIFTEYKLPKSFDFISIDVDGNDYHIWQSMTDFRPRVVAIEFNPAIPNGVIFVQDRDMDIHQGCSLAALIELGKMKRYELVATTNCNAFFVAAPEHRKLRIEDNSIDAMRANVPGRIFGTYDGTIYNKMRPLHWTGHGTQISEDTFQVLAPEERVFYDKLPEDE